MRLTIVRQDYRPEGLVERVIEPALEALLERNVAVSLYTRSWPQTCSRLGRATTTRARDGCWWDSCHCWGRFWSSVHSSNG